jgi:hypothetical protein
MDYDLILIIGIVILVLAVPSLLGAYSENRPPRAAMVLFVAGGGLVVYALVQSPSGYSFADIPGLFVKVIGRYLN